MNLTSTTNAAAQLPELTYSLGEAPPQPRSLHFFEPFEIYRDGKPTDFFHFCRITFPGEHIEPVGYCGKDCPGHRMPAEAREHYKQHLLDHHLSFIASENRPAQPCAVCGEATYVEAAIGDDMGSIFWVFKLCPTHANRETVERLFVQTDFVAAQ